MNILIFLVLAILILVLITLGMMAFAFYRYTHKSLENSTPTTDPLVLNQIESLRQQVIENLNQSQQLFNQQLSQTVSQVQQQVSSVTQNIQNSTGQIQSSLNNFSQVTQKVSTQLGSLSQATERIFETVKSISSLEDILKPPKLRGGMGEILLENILREVLPSKDFYEIQYSFKNGQTVDAIIRMRDGIIPIDAKSPLDNFKKMLESHDDQERQVLRKEFSKNVKKHIDDIANKYILPDEGTYNFALMYLPAENVFYEVILREENGTDTQYELYQYATSKKVFPVSPNSFYPYLITLSLGFRGLQIEERTREILGEIYRLQGDIERFSEHFKIVGDHLNNAQKKYSEAEKKLSKIEQKLETLKEGTADTAVVEIPN